MIERLSLTNLGPAPEMTFAFGERVNLLTGDNGLGKTFVLDLAWWALTRNWADGRIIRPSPRLRGAGIEYVVRGKAAATAPVALTYSDEARNWSPFPQGAPPAPGLVIYARIDGGFSVKDPERNRWRDRDEEGRIITRPEAFHFSKRQVWEGLRDDEDRVVCRGLVEDWETWRLKSNGAFAMITQVLADLSPGGKEHPLRPGIPVRLPDDFGDVDIPTIIMPHGEEVPIYHASAAVRRILSLAYLIVWAWTEHRIAAEIRGHEPARRIVLLWDEVESHLHPQWQRTILPSVVDVLERLLRESDGTQLQVIATTHAPLLLASMETRWIPARDRLFNLELTEDGKQVEVEEVPWARFGDASGWLTSPAFDMESGYSREAERAMSAADHLIAEYADELPDNLQDPESIHQELLRTLDAGDPFWPLWLPFFRSKGGKP
ncbi:MAG: ATP-binding protein [Verrucomicrobia bacterium]|nr:ATP-binding protein [Verrucomicrobiota bacterium]